MKGMARVGAALSLLALLGACGTSFSVKDAADLATTAVVVGTAVSGKPIIQNETVAKTGSVLCQMAGNPANANAILETLAKTGACNLFVAASTPVAGDSE